VIPQIQALRKSVADRITAAAAAGKPIWILSGSQVELPGVQRVALGGIVPALHGQPAANRLLMPDTTDVVVGDLRVGRTPFVYVVNCYSDRWRGRTGGAFGIFYPLNPDPHLEIWPYIEERPGSQPRPTKAVTTHLASADPTLTFYDLYAHRQLTSLDVDLAPADGKLLAGYRQPLGKMRLEAAESATQGRSVIVRIHVQDVAGKPFVEPVPIKFTVHGPDDQASVYSHSVLAQNGVAEVSLPFAINDAPGRWTLDAVNLANGERAEANVKLE